MPEDRSDSQRPRVTVTLQKWLPEESFGIATLESTGTAVQVPKLEVLDWRAVTAGTRLSCEITFSKAGYVATRVMLLHTAEATRSEPDPPRGKEASAQPAESPLPAILSRLSERADAPIPGTRSAHEDAELSPDDGLLSEELEDLDTRSVSTQVLEELSQWKREAKAEDNDRYFWHLRETDSIARGDKYFVIGRKGSGKTAICEYFNRRRSHSVFAEKLSFKNFPFNELYGHTNQKFTAPNQFITIWKYLIYSSVCRLMLKNEAIDNRLRAELSKLYDDKTPLSRRVGRWVGKEFGLSLFGLSFKVANHVPEAPKNWTEHVDFLEDLLSQYAGEATYFVLFDELDEDYRDIVEAEQFQQYTALITSLFKAVQDVRTTFADKQLRLYPTIFLRDDIYDLVQDADKNKWGDFRIDLTWDTEKIKRLIAFRISRAINPTCTEVLPFESAWARVFGRRAISVGKRNKKISTFDFIARSTLLRPRDFVAYLQACAHHALENGTRITPSVVRSVDKAFSNYLRQELTDELFALLPDIANIFDAISQLRKWAFSISELEKAHLMQVERGFIKERNVKYVLQVLFLFSVIGNTPRAGRYIFRYQNREARLNFNESVVVHRGLFKALQIL